MRHAWILLINIYSAFVLSASLPKGHPLSYRRALPLSAQPKEDPFYDAPSGFEQKQLGAILKHRTFNGSEFGAFHVSIKPKEAHQFLIRSEDSHGNPNAVVTTLFIPFNSDPTKLLSYQVAQDSSDVNCSPSYAMRLQSDPGTWISSGIEILLSQSALYEGWNLVIPDYEGPKAAFAAAHQAAYATINSIRAVLNSGNFTGISKNAKVALWGYSGGSIPSSWSAHLQPTYAPEINLVGSAYGGLVANLTHVAKYNFGTFFSGLIFAALNGLSHEYPAFSDAVEQVIGDSSKLEEVRSIDDKCEVHYILDFMFKNLTDYSSMGFEALKLQEISSVLSNNSILNLEVMPEAPVYIYNSVNDEVIPASDTDIYYQKLKKNNNTIFYQQDVFGEHIEQFIVGSGGAFAWLKDRMEGKELKHGAKKVVSLNNALTLNSLEGLPTIISSLIKQFEGDESGPRNLVKRIFKNLDRDY